MIAIQVQIQALLVVTGVIEKLNTRSNMKMAKPLIFNREVEKIGGFITVYRLYLRIKMREVTTKEQIQWILSYI